MARNDRAVRFRSTGLRLGLVPISSQARLNIIVSPFVFSFVVLITLIRYDKIPPLSSKMSDKIPIFLRPDNPGLIPCRFNVYLIGRYSDVRPREPIVINWKAIDRKVRKHGGAFFRLSDPNPWTPAVESLWLDGSSVKQLSLLRTRKPDAFAAGWGHGNEKTKSVPRLTIHRIGTIHPATNAKVVSRSASPLDSDRVCVSVEYGDGMIERYDVVRPSGARKAESW